MPKQNIHSEAAPKAIGPYSQAVRCGNTVYLAGQIGLDPKSMELVSGIDRDLGLAKDDVADKVSEGSRISDAHRAHAGRRPGEGAEK